MPHPLRRPAICALLTLAFARLLSGCAQPGLPQPPSLKLPTPVTDLSAARAGNTVTLRFTTSRRATDNVLLPGLQKAVVCRTLSPTSPCQPAGTTLVTPGQPATYSDSLPPELTTGPPRLLLYKVLLQNSHSHDAGPSNPAYSAAGEAPSPIQQLTAQATPSGITLSWQPAAPPSTPCLVRLQRTLLLPPGQTTLPPTPASQGAPQPIEQTLVAPQGCTLPHTTDHDALLNRTYRYSALRVLPLTLSGHPVELLSASSAPTELEARDLFPPQPPTALSAVADPPTHTIDLSWSPSPEPDLAGYYVYRSSSPQAPPERISGPNPLPDASFRDLHPTPGTPYAYSVSAVDTSGNESSRSAPATETLTNP